MTKVRAVVADDSIVYRSQIKSALAAEGIEVVAAAANGKLAVDYVLQTGANLLILDLEMPVMDGLQALIEIRAKDPMCKVVMFSSLSKRAAETTMEALKLGASDFITKPGATVLGAPESSKNPVEKIAELLGPRVRALFESVSASRSKVFPKPATESNFAWDLFRPDVVVIGSSTGGPTALEKIFSALKCEVSCPILIAQHMPPIFTATFAERLGKISGIPAAEAKDGDLLVPNRIYVAPGDYHARIRRSRDGAQLFLDQAPQVHSVRPAVDPLFISAAATYGAKCLGIVLTGMGEDGRDGALEIKKMGGMVVIQDKESSVVYGMPGAVFAAQAYDKIQSIESITRTIRDAAGTYTPLAAGG